MGKIVFNYIVLIFMGLAFIKFTGCGENEQDPLLSTPLEGEIDGVIWEYTVGKALFDNFTQSYTIELFESQSLDACSQFGSDDSYVSFSIPTSPQFISQPSTSYQSLQFHQPNSPVIYTATQGYIEIILINNFEIRGVIDSRFDEENFLQGVFSAELCN